MSIGSNDLTQLTLGLDRDSGLEQLAADFDERDPAVKALISRAIAACRASSWARARSAFARWISPARSSDWSVGLGNWESRLSHHWSC